MRIQNKINILLISTFAIMTLLDFFLKSYIYKYFLNWENYLWVFIKILFYLFIAFAVALVSSSLIKGQYVKETFLKYFFWTNSIALLIAIYFSVSICYEGINYYKKENIAHNENYKNFYGDSRNIKVQLAIKAIETKQNDVGKYRIFRMRVIEKDTLIKNEMSKYYDIHQLYFLDKARTDQHTFVSRHLVFNNNAIEELYNKPFLQDSTGFKELEVCQTLIKKMFTDKTLDSIRHSVEDFAIDVVKLYE